MPGRVEFRLTKGPLAGSSFLFDRHDTLVFGRAPDCHVRLPADDSSASRHHFLLEVNPPAARLRDLGSLNGTYVNRVKFGGRHAGTTAEPAGPIPQVDLRDGDVIKVGKTRIEVHVDARCERCGADLSWHGNCPSCPAAPEPGDGLPLVEGYAIERLLGEGGMGTVHLARARGGGRVALKLVPMRAAGGTRERAEFAREIALAASLRHAHVVEVLEHGCAAGGCYLVMEYCAGGSMEALRRRRGGRVPLPEAGPLVLDALEGLAYAHERNVIHRDLKPGNLLLTAEDGGRAKVADFGLAKSFEMAGLSGITLTGTFGGSYPFMPREQILDFKYCRPPTDVWGMAATFYFLLTGCSPHEFPPDRDPLVAILDGSPIPLRERDPGIPPRIAEVVDRALAIDIAQRHPDARALHGALAAVL